MAFYVRSEDVRKTPAEAGLSRAWEGRPQTFELSLPGATGGGKGAGVIVLLLKERRVCSSLCV